jgi:hypothetical protein
VLDQLLFGVDAGNLLAVAVAGALLVAVAVGAALRRAVEASRVDPVVALRAE